jgi:hypothetical protein
VVLPRDNARYGAISYGSYCGKLRQPVATSSYDPTRPQPILGAVIAYAQRGPVVYADGPARVIGTSTTVTERVATEEPVQHCCCHCGRARRRYSFTEREVTTTQLAVVPCEECAHAQAGYSQPGYEAIDYPRAGDAEPQTPYSWQDNSRRPAVDADSLQDALESLELGRGSRAGSAYEPSDSGRSRRSSRY